MADNIDDATEVKSERVEVPLDPGCHLVRAFYAGAGRWHTFDSTPHTAEEALGSARAARSTGKYLATRIVRIPPQGEQPTDDGMMRVDRETLVEMYEYFTMHTDEDAIVFGSTLKLILGDHHE